MRKQKSDKDIRAQSQQEHCLQENSKKKVSLLASNTEIEGQNHLSACQHKHPAHQSYLSRETLKHLTNPPMKQQFDYQNEIIEASQDLQSDMGSNKTTKKKPVFYDQFSFECKIQPPSQQPFYCFESQQSQDQTVKQQEFSEQIVKKKRIVKSGSGRKVRTTITQQKLDNLNAYFKEYFQYKNRGKQPPLTIRQISKIMNLSYSTTMHKSSVYRINRQLKPGLLLSSLTKKRKYKKSYECQNYIQASLKARPFYTVQSLAKFIFRTYGVSYPRSIIGRHLTQMGYSCNNIKTSTIDKNSPKCISIRKVYANILQPLLISPLCLIYVDQFAFSKNIFRIKTTYSQYEFEKQKGQTEDDYVSVMIAMNCQKIIFYDIKYGFYEKTNFIHCIGQIHKSVLQSSYKLIRNLCLITDMHKIHYDNQSNYDPKRSITSTIEQYAMRRLFLPPGSQQLNPIQLLISNLKKMLNAQRSEIVDCDTLRLKLIKFMKVISSEPTKRFFYDFQKWLYKAKEGIPY